MFGVVAALGPGKQICAVGQLHFDRSPLSVKRLVGRFVSDAIDGTQIANDLRVHGIKIAEASGLIQWRAADTRNLSELFASFRVGGTRDAIALDVLFFRVEINWEN